MDQLEIQLIKLIWGDGIFTLHFDEIQICTFVKFSHLPFTRNRQVVFACRCKRLVIFHSLAERNGCNPKKYQYKWFNNHRRTSAIEDFEGSYVECAAMSKANCQATLVSRMKIVVENVPVSFSSNLEEYRM